MKALTPNQIDEMNSVRWWHRIPVGTFNGETVYTPGEVSHGPNGGDWPTSRFGLPDDLSGKTVLDIGAWDGLFSFLAEERGGTVTAIDVTEQEGGHWGGATAGFDFAKNARGSKVDFKHCNINEAGSLGKQFDLVLCYGVLYHLQDPLRALKPLYAVTADGGICLIETACIAGDSPTWDFRPGHDNDPTNYWYPTYAGLRAALIWAGFKSVELIFDLGSVRMTVKATK